MNNDKSALNIYVYPNSVLRRTAEPIENINQDTQSLVDRMVYTMYAAHGIGLAANQIGRLERVIVFDLHPEDEGKNPCVLINPEIVLKEGEMINEEACLSVVDFSAEVVRSAQVKVRGADRHGRPMDINAEGITAICLQHEIDHLNGTLYIDHISNLKRALYKKKLKKKRERK